ncbi:HYC_CC_PP family protein [Aquimarina intermedia]|nr:hypothetical protein [Aquimarina intermedia]
MAAFMACIVLGTTMSFTVDMHFCGDTIVDFSFVQKAKSCGMDMIHGSLDCESPLISQNTCCSDTQLLVEGQDELNTSFDSLAFEQQTFVAAFFYSYSLLFDAVDSHTLTKPDYRRAWGAQDLHILHQIFLI